MVAPLVMNIIGRKFVQDQNRLFHTPRQVVTEYLKEQLGHSDPNFNQGKWYNSEANNYYQPFLVMFLNALSVVDQGGLAPLKKPGCL